MTSKEEAEFTERLTKQFVLIPRDRLYHFLGGAVAVVVVAFGINVGSVLAFLKMDTANTARNEILELKRQATEDVQTMKARTAELTQEIQKHLDDLGVDAYVRTHRQYNIRTDDGNFGLFISNGKVGNGANVVVAKGRSWSWELVPVGK